MRGRPLLLVPALAALACVILAGCTAGGTSGASRRTTASSSQRAATSAHAAGRIGSPANPLLLTCAEESFPVGSLRPGPGDLAIGPLIIGNGKLYANAKPVDHEARKIPFIVLPGMTVTVTIGAQARGRVWIDNPYAQINWGVRLVAAATYRACSPGAPRQGFFAQGFAFTSGPVRACLPLDVRIGHQAQVRHITLSLFAGSCPP